MTSDLLPFEAPADATVAEFTTSIALPCYYECLLSCYILSSRLEGTLAQEVNSCYLRRFLILKVYRSSMDDLACSSYYS